jgi:hypothetical protein
MFNDQRQQFSASYTFRCWEKTPLSSVSGVFSNDFLQDTGGNPNEMIGDPDQKAGWMEINGHTAVTETVAIDNPPVLAFLIDRIEGGAVAGIPFGVGSQAGGLPSPVAPPQPPDCPSGVSLSLWPPNHQYVAVDLVATAGVTDPNGQPLSIVITSITQDEPINANGQGDGNTVCDGTGVGTSVAQLRAERQGGGNGRVYRVNYTATNAAGDACSSTLTVTVPHDQSGAPAVDDGQTVNSSTGCP